MLVADVLWQEAKIFYRDGVSEIEPPKAITKIQSQWQRTQRKRSDNYKRKKINLRERAEEEGLIHRGWRWMWQGSRHGLLVVVTVSEPVILEVTLSFCFCYLLLSFFGTCLYLVLVVSSYWLVTLDGRDLRWTFYGIKLIPCYKLIIIIIIIIM